MTAQTTSRRKDHRKPLAVLAGARALALLLACLAPSALAQIGQTQFVDGNTPIPDDLRTTIGDLIPELGNPNAAFESPVYRTTLEITETTQLRVHFVWESVGYENSLGYVTFTENPLTIVDRQLIFPNASRGATGPLTVGDHSLLRDLNGTPRNFTAGQRVAFFVVSDGYREEAQIASWDASTATLPSLDPAVNALSSSARGTYLSLDELNPELATEQPEISRHAATLAMPGHPDYLDGAPYVLVGFEHQNREHSDHDFNDLVIAVESTTPNAVDRSTLAVAYVGDPDEDGIRGTSDHYPNDPDRALITSVPSVGWNGVGLEDLYPVVGDGDFNDTYILYRFDTVTDAKGDVKDIQATFHLIARGTLLDHRLGFHFPGLPENTKGSVRVERWLSDDAETNIIEQTLEVEDLVKEMDRRLETVLPSTSLAMPEVDGKFAVNTLQPSQDRMGATSRFVMSFDQAVPAAVLGDAPWDMYWLVNDGTQWVDIHMPGFASFDDHPEQFVKQTGPKAYLDADGLPWMIHVSNGFRFPLEFTPIETAYPNFLSWAGSHGTLDEDWLQAPKPGVVSQKTTDFFTRRAWTVALPQPQAKP